MLDLHRSHQTSSSGLNPDVMGSIRKWYLLSPTKSVDTTSSSVYPKIPFKEPSDATLCQSSEWNEKR